jgi:hypothetical protein
MIAIAFKPDAAHLWYVWVLIGSWGFWSVAF